ncbi:MAG: sigma-54 interaction domain-containing protein [Candidatus Rokuibacteriota bacterium]
MSAHGEPDRGRETWSHTLDDFHSADPAMEQCFDLARLAARTGLPILIVGESGTGKTLLARAVHNSSRRARGPFVAFNAAALSDTLVDSQLFGHEKGAFTGAERMVRGKFELAHGGTLFVDEIADMSAAAQAKVLRAVEYGEFERLGSEVLQRADVRLVSATHWPLARFVETERFRKDLFYRISGITLTLPPLRERPNDLRALIASEVRVAGAGEGKAITGLAKEAADLLLSYAWPGNLRELKTVVQTAVALTSADVIRPEAILLHRDLVPRLPAAAVDGDASLAAAERRHIGQVLASVGGNKRRAAKLLGISRSTLDRKLEEATR